jgi:very-short-patch-repair endonuclease
MSNKPERWKEHALSMIDTYLYQKKYRETDELLCWLDACESPIERIMGAELSFITIFGVRARKFGIPPFKRSALDKIERLENLTDYEIEVWPQQKIGDYRVDFLLLARFRDTGSLDRDLVRIVIECDGHDFHERTKEQAARDRGRDRFMQRAGYKVFRFTGSEIYHSPETCSDEIATYLEDIARREDDAA